MTISTPTSGEGAIHWVIFGIIAGSIAILAGSIFPSIIPSRAAQVRL